MFSVGSHRFNDYEPFNFPSLWDFDENNVLTKEFDVIFSSGKDKAIKEQLAKNNFIGAMNIASHDILTYNFDLIAEKIKEAKLDPTALAKIEEAADGLIFTFKKMILKALLSIYQTLGNTEESSRLEKKISEMAALRFRKPLDDFKKMLSITLALYAGSMVASAGASIPVACAAGVATGAAFQFPAIRKTENVLGMGAGLGAAAAGLGALPAAGVGLGTALVTRVPLIQNIAKGTVYGVGSLIKGTGKLACNIVDKTANVIGGVVDKTADVIAGVGTFAVDGTVSLVSGVAEGLLYMVNGSIQATGKLISGTSNVLDSIVS